MINVKVSVIIPIYNVEKYVGKCLDSVVNQTLKNIEIICVNDGSTDNSLRILEEYSQKDRRINIINKKNKGASWARKTGLNAAKGEFIAFVDSDDWVESDTFEKMYENAIQNNSDLVMLNFRFYDETKNEYSDWPDYNIAKYFDENVDFNNFVFDHNSIKIHLLNLSHTAWSKLYRSEFLSKYDDFYLEMAISLGEDVPFHVQVLLRANRISFCNYKLYNYRTSNLNSICNLSVNNEKIFDIFKAIDTVENILVENSKMDVFRYEFFTFIIVQSIQWFNECDMYLKNDFFNCMKKYFSKIDYDEDKIKCSSFYKNNYQNISNSYSYREFDLNNKILKLKTTIKNDVEINFKRDIESQKQDYEKKLEFKDRTINEIIYSKSWKVTKPLRYFGKIMRVLRDNNKIN
jgi:glycosyltransferase involved in cell wall biosynthesis